MVTSSASRRVDYWHGMERQRTGLTATTKAGNTREGLEARHLHDGTGTVRGRAGGHLRR
jgi:hypothetical protein